MGLWVTYIWVYVIWMGEVKWSEEKWLNETNEWMTSGLLTNSYWKFVYGFSIFLSFHLLFGWLLQKLYVIGVVVGCLSCLSLPSPHCCSLPYCLLVVLIYPRIESLSPSTYIFRCQCVFTSIHCDWLNMFWIDDDVCVSVCVYDFNGQARSNFTILINGIRRMTTVFGWIISNQLIACNN